VDPIVNGTFPGPHGTLDLSQNVLYRGRWVPETAGDHDIARDGRLGGREWPRRDSRRSGRAPAGAPGGAHRGIRSAGRSDHLAAVSPDKHSRIETLGTTRRHRGLSNAVRDDRRNYPLNADARTDALRNPGRDLVSGPCRRPSGRCGPHRRALSPYRAGQQLRVLKAVNRWLPAPGTTGAGLTGHRAGFRPGAVERERPLAWEGS
jgi:hypothetical protein